jgi:integrase
MTPCAGSGHIERLPSGSCRVHVYARTDPVTVAVLGERKRQVQDPLASVGVTLAADAYVFSSDSLGAAPWNPDWVTHKVARVADAAGVRLNVKALRHYTASQLLAGGPRRQEGRRIGTTRTFTSGRR